MGRIRIDRVPVIGGTPGTARQGAMESDMQPVGRRRKVEVVDLMRVGERAGTLTFLGPVKSEVEFAREEVTVGGRSIAWWRHEIRVDRVRADDATEAPLDGAREGEAVVVTEWPWSQEWADLARLRKANKDALDPTRDWAGLSPDDVICRVDALDYDVFETNHRYLTAAISRPLSTLGIADPRATRDGYEVYGLCADHDGYTRALLETDVVARLIATTRRGTLDCVPKNAKVEGVIPRRLPREARTEALSLMLLSLRQTLAGPAHGDDADWVGEPVAKLAEQIYKGHVWNLVKRVLNREEFEKKHGKLLREYLRKHPDAGATPGDDEEAAAE